MKVLIFLLYNLFLYFQGIERLGNDSMEPPTSYSETKRVSFSLVNTTNQTSDFTSTDGSSLATDSAHLSQTQSSVPLIDDSKTGDSKVAVNIEDLEVLKVEGEAEEKEKEEEKPVAPSHGLRSLLRRGSIIDVIPEEAESITVMVGGVKVLENPVTAFVRLKQVREFKKTTTVALPDILFI